MREKLAELEGQRIRVRALIERYGHTTSASTYLLLDVRAADTGDLLADHLWIPVGSWAFGFRPGDTIEFSGAVRSYWKGYLGECPPPDAPRVQLDFVLDEPSSAQVVQFGPQTRMMADDSIRP